MRLGWKRLAERAARAAFAPEEVLDTIPAALEQDWRAEVSESLCRTILGVLTDPQRDLFGDAITQLDSIRAASAGFSLSQTLLDCTMLAVYDGYAQQEALIEGARLALQYRAASGARQVEEHYYRKSTTHRPDYVRARIESAISQSDLAAIARRLVTGNDRPTRAAVNKTSLDDGVLLSAGRHELD